jgi:hypothetical protein
LETIRKTRYTPPFVKADDLLDDFRKVWAGNKVIPESGHVRFESLADICSAKGHIRFAPIATAKADFHGPKADIASSYRASMSGSFHVLSNNGFSPLGVRVWFFEF